MAETTIKKTKTTRAKKAATPVKKAVKAVKKPVTSPFTSTIKTITQPVNNTLGRIQKIPRRYQWGVVILVLVALLGAYFKSFFVAALVNGQPILRWTIISELEKDGGQKALDNLVSKTLILQEATKQKIVISQSEIDDEINKIKDSITKNGGEYESAIKAEGFTDQSLRENIILNKTLTKMVEKDVQVTDEEIQKYRDENKDSLPKDKSEDEIKAMVKDELTSNKRSDKVQELVTKLKKDAKINYWVKY